MDQSATSASLLKVVPDVGVCPDCGVATAIDSELLFKPHSGYRGKPKDCVGGGKAAGQFGTLVFPERPARAPSAVLKEATVRFQADKAWRTQLTCGKCSKIETLPYATLQRVMMPFHGKWVNGNREPCPGGDVAAVKQGLIARRTDRNNTIVGIFVMGLILVAAFGLLSSCWNALSDDSSGGSSDYVNDRYSDAECAALRFEGLGDGPGAEDALVQWSVYC